MRNVTQKQNISLKPSDKVRAVIVATAVIVAGIGGASMYPVDPQPLNLNEFFALQDLYQHEMEKLNGQTFTNVKSFTDIRDQFHTAIRARTPDSNEEISIGQESVSVADYVNIREGLLQRTEQTNVIGALMRKIQ